MEDWDSKRYGFDRMTRVEGLRFTLVAQSPVCWGPVL